MIHAIHRAEELWRKGIHLAHRVHMVVGREGSQTIYEILRIQEKEGLWRKGIDSHDA